MVSVVWDQRAFPIYWTLLPKLGSSNLDEQTKILSQILPLFKNSKICILGDREFCSVKLANWLRAKSLYFCLRLKKSHFIEVEKDIWLELSQVGLVPGVSIFFQGVKVTKTNGFENFNVACKWQRKTEGNTPKEGGFILTNFSTLKEAIAGYKKRFALEEMFRDFKKGGYNLESTNVTGKRLINLILLMAIAYTSATIHGQEIKQKGVQKYVGRVKETGRIERRHSSFYMGLYGENWVNFSEPCKDLVRQLMKLNRNKRPFYQRGLRAMELIMEAS